MGHAESATESAIKHGAYDDREPYYLHAPDEVDDCPPSQAEAPKPKRGSRYKKGRRWWEQSPWERKR